MQNILRNVVDQNKYESFNNIIIIQTSFFWQYTWFGFQSLFPKIILKRYWTRHYFPNNIERTLFAIYKWQTFSYARLGILNRFMPYSVLHRGTTRSSFLAPLGGALGPLITFPSRSALYFLSAVESELFSLYLLCYSQLNTWGQIVSPGVLQLIPAASIGRMF